MTQQNETMMRKINALLNKTIENGATEAAAQGKTSLHDCERCKTCNGSRLVGFKDELGHCVKCCQDCNGTGNATNTKGTT